MSRIYLAGPMRGIPYFNFPAFDAAAEKLRAAGHEVISPAEMDREAGFDPKTLPEDWDWKAPPAEHFSMRAALRRDFDAIMECQEVQLLPGWQRSTGAQAEAGLARWIGIPVWEYQPEDILDEAARITRGDRQAAYGPPEQDFRRTAGMWTALFGHLLKDGAQFEPVHVAEAMILLKMSRQVHQKKRDNWVDVAGYARCGALCDEVSSAIGTRPASTWKPAASSGG